LLEHIFHSILLGAIYKPLLIFISDCSQELAYDLFEILFESKAHLSILSNALFHHSDAHFLDIFAHTTLLTNSIIYVNLDILQYEGNLLALSFFYDHSILTS